MNIYEAIELRNSVRSYTDRNIEGETLDSLNDIIDVCNRDSGLNIQLCLNEASAFSGMMARYGKFKNVNNYIALVGKNISDFQEKCGYYGEKMVLHAQQLGLNTCWVGMSYSKTKSKQIIKINEGEELLMVIAIGYGQTQGVSHKPKNINKLFSSSEALPDWFLNGMKSVSRAPSAMNQQKFVFTLNRNKVSASTGFGFYTKIDLGIAKYHFEVGAGDNNWKWQT